MNQRQEFGGDIEDLEYGEVNLSAYKVPINTCNTLRNNTSVMSPHPNNQEGFPEPLDLSIDCHLYHNNAVLIEEGLLSYIKTCLGEPFEKNDVLGMGRLFNLPSLSELQNEGESEIYSLVQGNKLLSQHAKAFLQQNFQEFHELTCLLVEIKNLIGPALTQEIVFILSVVLERKMDQFKDILAQQQNQWLIPKFQRFWGDEEMQATMEGEFKTYGQTSYEEIRKITATEIEKLASQLYFSKQLKFINMKQIRAEVRTSINVKDKFASLVIFLTRNAFLTLAGIGQTDSQLDELMAELGVHTSEEGDVTGCDLTKRIKI